MSIHRNTIEFFRNFIHTCTGLIPWLAFRLGVLNTVYCILALCIFYTVSELTHLRYPHVRFIIDFADRNQAHGTFVLGPLSLAFGVCLVLLFFPLTIASPAILVLAFGDSISSVFGVRFGKHRLPYGHKSWEGSLSCLCVSLLLLLLTGHKFWIAALTAVLVTIAESTAIRDLDNILVPTSAALALSILAL